ncbi:STAS domain-containing protein [Mycolicibacterium fortuitum]
MLGFIVESNPQDHELHWTAHPTSEGLIVQVFGQVDAHNEADWQRMLDESAVAVPEGSLLIVDCGSLDFMSCGALVALAKQAVDSRQRGVTVRSRDHAAEHLPSHHRMRYGRRRLGAPGSRFGIERWRPAIGFGGWLSTG